MKYYISNLKGFVYDINDIEPLFNNGFGDYCTNRETYRWWKKFLAKEAQFESVATQSQLEKRDSLEGYDAVFNFYKDVLKK